MPSRTNLLDIFSSFLKVDGDRFDGWSIDTKLRRNMERHQERQSISEEQLQSLGSLKRYWSLYWYFIWRDRQLDTAPQNYSRSHLFAYLQEACRSAVFEKQNILQYSDLSIIDCFQFALAQTDEILRGFMPGMGNQLDTYAQKCYITKIKEHLRSRQEWDSSTNWGLLRHISRRKMQEALVEEGLNQEQIAQYLLGCKCFQNTYMPPTARNRRALPPPTEEQWQAIADEYNKQRHRLTSSETITVEKIEMIINQCARFVKNYNRPPKLIPIAPISDEPNSRTLEDVIEGSPSAFQELIEKITEQERQFQREQIDRVLRQALSELPPARQEELRLEYKEELKQKEIAKQTQQKQYQVSRHLQRSRRYLTEQLAQWSKEELHISLDPDKIEMLDSLVKDWLKQHFQPLET